MIYDRAIKNAINVIGIAQEILFILVISFFKKASASILLINLLDYTGFLFKNIYIQKNKKLWDIILIKKNFLYLLDKGRIAIIVDLTYLTKLYVGLNV